MKLIPIIGAFLLIAAMSLGGCAGLKEDPRSAKLNPNDRTNYPGQDGFNPALFALNPGPLVSPALAVPR